MKMKFEVFYPVTGRWTWPADDLELTNRTNTDPCGQESLSSWGELMLQEGY